MWEALPSDFMLKEQSSYCEDETLSNMYKYPPKIENDNWIHDTYQSYIPNYGESMKAEDLVMSSY
jgi:hypothetical protein